VGQLLVAEPVFSEQYFCLAFAEALDFGLRRHGVVQSEFRRANTDTNSNSYTHSYSNVHCDPNPNTNGDCNSYTQANADSQAECNAQAQANTGSSTLNVTRQFYVSANPNHPIGSLVSAGALAERGLATEIAATDTLTGFMHPTKIRRQFALCFLPHEGSLT
jgi:hypothetical protein